MVGNGKFLMDIGSFCREDCEYVSGIDRNYVKLRNVMAGSQRFMIRSEILRGFDRNYATKRWNWV